MMKNLIVTILILVFFITGYFLNDYNYKIHKKYELENIQNSNQFIINKEYIKLTSFGFSKLQSDIIWLNTIKYIAENISYSKYKEYLFFRIESLLTLDPYFEHPYIVAGLLSGNNDKIYDKHIQKSIEILEGGIEKFCNKELLGDFISSKDLHKLKDKKYTGICNSYMIPKLLGDLNFIYKKDKNEAKKYYELASLHKDSLKGVDTILALINSDLGENLISSMIYFDLAIKFDENNSICSELSLSYQKLLKDNNFKINKELIEFFNNYFYSVDFLDNEKKCSDQLGLALRGLNLYYLNNVYKTNEKDIEDFEQFLKYNKGIYIPRDLFLGVNYYINNNYINIGSN